MSDLRLFDCPPSCTSLAKRTRETSGVIRFTAGSMFPEVPRPHVKRGLTFEKIIYIAPSS